MQIKTLMQRQQPPTPPVTSKRSFQSNFAAPITHRRRAALLLAYSILKTARGESNGLLKVHMVRSALVQAHQHRRAAVENEAPTLDQGLGGGMRGRAW